MQRSTKEESSRCPIITLIRSPEMSTENILLLAFMPLAASLFAAHSYGFLAVWALVVFLLWNKFNVHRTVAPEPLRISPSDRKQFGNDEIALLAYIPLAASLFYHFFVVK